ncbi:dysbindin isoform X5 [Trichechus manatus latirostris]|uniref:Dysbindin isoform X5 n=1 Tax=Trichechus manatus latirostris TaxID=127582 RepID=A0A2Y9RFT0_TRIMA|nr:dysbindin isoform X5 [Trichechus manatus latirostris]
MLNGRLRGAQRLKTLSDKSREAKVKSQPRTVPCVPKYCAGLELLSRYEDTWAALHRRAKECAIAGELVDSEVVMLSAFWERKKTSLVELQEQLQQLPGLIADLESMQANLTHLEASFEEVENHLLHLEDLCGQCELERCKHTQSQQLENYKKNKRKELETFKVIYCDFCGSRLQDEKQSGLISKTSQRKTPLRHSPEAKNSLKFEFTFKPKKNRAGMVM